MFLFFMFYQWSWRHGYTTHNSRIICETIVARGAGIVNNQKSHMYGYKSCRGKRITSFTIDSSCRNAITDQSQLGVFYSVSAIFC